MTVKEWVDFNSSIINDNYLIISIEVVTGSDSNSILRGEVNTFKDLKLIFGDCEVVNIFPQDSGNIAVTLKKEN